jgi:selenide,water dikinase
MQEPPRRRLLLAGGGHSHALLLRMWAMRPRMRPAATAITLVSRAGSSLYSGMVPGLVAGLYDRRACAIDLRLLCSRVGVTFIQAEIDGLDPVERRLRLVERPPLAYELLSLNVGAITVAPRSGGGSAMAVKPLEPFLRWCDQQQPGSRLRIRGGGAAAVELALALQARGLRCELLLRSSHLQLGSSAAERAAERLLAHAGVRVQRRVSDEAEADLLCTGSHAPAWLAEAGLPVDAVTGRVLTGTDLRVEGWPDLLASGDCALIRTAPRPPSGVWAVRAAPLLAHNLQQLLDHSHQTLRRWRPQRRVLQLLADGSRTGAARAGMGAGGKPSALALWGPLALGPHPWIWLLKDRIDRGFLRRLGQQPDANLAADTARAQPAMACRGCAAKLAAAPLEAALARLDPSGQAPAAQDAVALLPAGDGPLLLQSIDGFPALVDDPWLNGRLTALHACSDLWASAAGVESAQALVTLPQVAATLQEELLFQCLAGVRSVLDPLGARLIGGHTLEGRDGAGLSLALCVQGRVAAGRRAWGKGPLRPGDALLLSRPLGSGVLLAAAMAGAADPLWLDELLKTLQQSQAPLVGLLAAQGCHACTDITGFGVLGHLGEMLAASPGVRLNLDPQAIPAWPGALELLRRGYASTLAPSNARSLALLEGPICLRSGSEGAPAPGSKSGADATSEALSDARLALLLDPQTCGPLLAVMPADQAWATVEALRRAGFHQAAEIARVEAWVEG